MRSILRAAATQVMLHAFLAHVRAPVQDRGRLESALRRALETGQRAHPQIAVDPEVFAGWLGERVLADEDPRDALATLRADQLYLACACSQGSSPAIAALRSSYLHRVDRALVELGLSPDQQEEIAQRLLVRLTTRADTASPQITRYGGRGDLGRWLRAVAVRAAIDLLRSEGRQIPVGDDILIDRALPEADPGLAHMKQRYRADFQAALRKAFAALDAASRTDLRLYYFDELTLDELAALHRVAPSTISRRLARTRRVVFEATRALLREQIGVDDRELDSILQLIASRLEVSRSALCDGDR